ncbi:acyltransferase family protein [Nocardioides pacificus]
MTRTKPGFRGDIQGLRALAVVTVIVSHFDIGPFTGGFIGVDVFFVISGFLISDLLYRELGREGSISLRRFYARRARRILPAATLVVLVTTVASVIVLSALDAAEVVWDAIWASLFAANFRFASVGTDYFAQDQGTSPLQHYWSLAVEEQFYLLWPLLLLVATGWHRLRRWQAARGAGEDPAPGPLRVPRLTVFVLLVVGTVASFAWSVVLTRTDPTDAYFSPFARAWELGAGALVALVAPALARRFTHFTRAALSSTGLLLIAAATLFFIDATPFPGHAALLPVVGTAMVLLSGATTSDRRPLLRPPLPLQALAWAPIRVVGDWSYSLYLWHWPVLVLAQARIGRDLRLSEALVAVAVTFALAAATYRWVETPFRDPVRWSVPRSLVLYPVSVALIAATALGGSRWTEWQTSERGDAPAVTLDDFGVEDVEKYDIAKDPAVGLVQASTVAAENGVALPSDLSPDLVDLRDDVAEGDCDYSDAFGTLCPQGDPDAGRTLAVLGDSHGRHWIPAFEQIAESAGWTTHYFVKPRCTAARVTVTSWNSDDPWSACDDFRDWVQEQLTELRPDVTIVSTSAPGRGVWQGDEFLTDEDDVAAAFRDGLADLLGRLAPLTERLLVLDDVPTLSTDPADCLTTGRPDLGTCLAAPTERSALMSTMTRQAAQSTGTELVDPRRWFCVGQKCPVVVGSTITYRDPGHITTTYAASLAEPLGSALGLAAPPTAAGAPP